MEEKTALVSMYRTFSLYRQRELHGPHVFGWVRERERQWRREKKCRNGKEELVLGKHNENWISNIHEKRRKKHVFVHCTFTYMWMTRTNTTRFKCHRKQLTYKCGDWCVNRFRSAHVRLKFFLFSLFSFLFSDDDVYVFFFLEWKKKTV